MPVIAHLPGSAPEARWRALVVDDHQLLSSSIVSALRASGEVEVVGTAASLAEAVELAGALRPDLVLTDRRLPDGDVEDHVHELRQACPSARILIMSGWLTERSSLVALEAGAHGLVSKARPLEDLLEALRQTMAGNLVLPAELAAGLLRRAGASQRAAVRSDLSRRELDVLEALAQGRSTVEAARELAISPNTLRNHLAKAMLKLGVHDRVAAVAEAVRRGLVSPQLPVAPLAGSMP